MNTPAPSAATVYAPAQAAVNASQANANALTAQDVPTNYRFDPYQINRNASLLSRMGTLQNRAALEARSPEAAAGQDEAIRILSGGVEGDDQFLRNAALKSGLYQAAGSGGVGPFTTVSPTSRGGVTAANIFGKELLNYRNNRAQQALGVAQSLQPDASINTGDLIGQQEGANIAAIQNENQWRTFLGNQRTGALQNLNNQTQQGAAAAQGQFNANAQAENANQNGKVAAGIGLVTAAAGAAAVIF